MQHNAVEMEPEPRPPTARFEAPKGNDIIAKAVMGMKLGAVATVKITGVVDSLNMADYGHSLGMTMKSISVSGDEGGKSMVDQVHEIQGHEDTSEG